MSTPSVESPSSVPERKGFYVRGWVLAVAGAVVLLVAAVTIGFVVRDDGGDGREGREGVREGARVFEHHGSEGHRGVAFVILLLLIAAAITAVVLIVRRNKARSGGGRTSAEDVLAERFARGEIDEPDYLSRRHALRS